MTEINKMATGQISIHALLAESDPGPKSMTPDRYYFYPRSPCGERRIRITNHALTEDISIHALLAESDHQTNAGSNESSEFLSTLSLRRATCYSLRHSAQSRHFYPRSPCGERHNINSSVNTADQISIHALLAESDYVPFTVADLGKRFLSTLSLRRATTTVLHWYHISKISIHALLAESDRGQNPAPRTGTDFYPRSPCGERRPCYGRLYQGRNYFYPRSPCGERREYWVGGYGTANNFYPRSPCGERLLTP